MCQPLLRRPAFHLSLNTHLPRLGLIGERAERMLTATGQHFVAYQHSAREELFSQHTLTAAPCNCFTSPPTEAPDTIPTLIVCTRLNGGRVRTCRAKEDREGGIKTISVLKERMREEAEQVEKKTKLQTHFK